MPICLQLSPSSAVLLSGGSERFEEALRLLYGMARTSPDTPTLVEALGIAALGMPYLPTEVPPEARERILKAGRASYYTATHRLEDADLLFKELIQSYPDTPNVHYSYGVLLLAGTPDKALEQFEPEIEISPLHVRARLQIAFEYIGRAEYEAGLSYARKAVELQPASFAARNALGRILLETGSVEEAVKELEESVRRAPDSPECRCAPARLPARRTA